MPRTLVARVLSQQARNSLFPAPPIQTTPPADREAGLSAGHSLTVALSCPALMDDRWKDSMGGQADEHMSRLNWSPTAPNLSMWTRCSLIASGPLGRKPEPGTHAFFCGSDCTRARC